MRPPETRILTCPACGAEQLAVISYSDRAKDDDWDDGACFQCATLIISERCGSISLVRQTSVVTAEATSVARQKADDAAEQARALQHIDPVAPERRTALINEARARAP